MCVRAGTVSAPGSLDAINAAAQVALGVTKEGSELEIRAEKTLAKGDDGAQVEALDIRGKTGQLACAVAAGVKLFALNGDGGCARRRIARAAVQFHPRRKPLAANFPQQPCRFAPLSNKANDLDHDAEQPVQVLSFDPAGLALVVAGDEGTAGAPHNQLRSHNQPLWLAHPGRYLSASFD